MKTTFRTKLLTSSAAVAILGFLPMGASAEYRTFTSTDGRTMNAELISASDTQVTVKMKSSKKQLKFPISLLSKDDQEYVQEWAEENVSYNLKIEAKKKMTGSEHQKDGNKKTNVKSYVYGVSVLNWGRSDLKDAVVRYRIFTGENKFNEGTYEIAELPRGASAVFESDGLTLKRCETTTKTGG